MVKSNTVTIRVVPKPPAKPHIYRVELSAYKETVEVGEKADFSYMVYFDKSITNEQANKYRVKITVYVNAHAQKTFYESLVPGTDYVAGDFSLVFTEPGTYHVQIDADIVEKQYSW